jgi:hypothetical protein
MTVELGVRHEGAPWLSMSTCPKQQVHKDNEWGQVNRFKSKRRRHKWAVRLGDGGVGGWMKIYGFGASKK